MSRFQTKVYRACKLIPVGKVSTYADVARRIGCASPRAVGQALRKNPYAPEVPCHRVISSSLKIGGFQGERAGAAVRKKLDLLKKEGVEFDVRGILRDRNKLWSK